MSNQWYPFFPGDYARDTVHLSNLEDLFYRRLLDYYYSTGEPLPANADRLHRVCRAFATEEKAAVLFVLSEFFEEEGAGYRNRKADEVLAKARVVSQKRAAAAKKRHGKPPANADGNPANAGANAGEKDANDHAKPVHPQPQPQPYIKPPPIRDDLPLTERMLREMVEEKREFIRTNYGLDDGEINIHLEEMVVKTRDRSPGPDLWLYASKFFKNRKDDLHGQRTVRGAAAPGGKTGGQRGAKAGGTGGAGVDAGQVSGGIDFEDRSDEWHKAL